jgi:tetratricopeptide (TPR) repeat protein
MKPINSIISTLIIAQGLCSIDDAKAMTVIDLNVNHSTIAQRTPQNKDSSDAYFRLGYIKSESGDLRGAMLDYDRSIELNYNNANAYNNRGSVKSDLGYVKEAIIDYTQAIQINPYLGNAYYNRGNAKYKLGDRSGAVSDLTKAAELYRQVKNR